MSLVHPLALWGLIGIPILILLERWRRRPRPTVWPSLLLWRGVAAAEAPRRRRIEPLLIYECAAVLLLSLAASEPELEAGRASRDLAVLVDEGPHMQARREDGRTALEATRAEVERIGPDRVVAFRGELPAAARFPGAVIATSRPEVGGPGVVVVGRAPHGDNLGIDAVQARGERLWFAVATDGEPRNVSVRVGEAVHILRTGTGFETAFAKEIEILDPDNYDGDDIVRLRRLELGVRDETGSRLVAAALSVGTPARAGDDLVVTSSGGTPVSGVVRGSDCVAAAGIFDGLFLDECIWRGAHASDGDGLLTHEGRALAAWRDGGRTLWLGLPLDREWDEHGTLAVLIERAKCARIEALLRPGDALVGDAIASPAPGHVDTKGVDRPWDGTLPESGARAAGSTSLRPWLALGAAAALALYLRAMLLGP